MTAKVCNRQDESNSLLQNKLETGDQLCGEIYVKLSGTLAFRCILCSSYIESYSHFFDHLSIQHYDDLQEDVMRFGVKNEESEVESQFQDDSTSKMYTEEESIYDDCNDSTISDGNITDTFCIDNDDCCYDDDDYENVKKFQIESVSTFAKIEEIFLEGAANLNNFKYEKAFEDEEEYGSEEEKNEMKMKNRSSSPHTNKTKKIRSLQHEEMFSCEKCGKEFGSRRKLRRHHNTHSEERKYRCEICGFAFKERPNLDAHVRRHSGVGSIDCGFCSKKFFTRAEAISHQRTHTGERPYVCTVCGVGFTNSARLKIHSKRHISEPEHKCSYCDKAFYGKAELKDHILVHTKEKAFSCKFCGGWFARRKSLMRHMNNLHANESLAKE